MSKMIINGEVVSGSTSYASAVEYTKEDGTKSTVQNELDELNTNIGEQNKNFENRIGFPNYSRVLDNTSLKKRGASYTATENCWVIGNVKQDLQSTAAFIAIDGVPVFRLYAYGTLNDEAEAFIPVKKGNVVTTRSDSGAYNLTVYAMT